MTRVLITGGAGFIGGHLVRHLLCHPAYRCVVLDRLAYSGSRESLPTGGRNGRFTFARGDVRNVGLVRRLAERADIIVHCAAYSHVDRSYDHPLEFASTNIMGTAAVLEAIRQVRPSLLIFLSTPEIHGNSLRVAGQQDPPIRPMSPYAGSKAAADRLAYSYHVTYDLPIVFVKPSNVYGPRQYPEKLVPFFITQALENRPLPAYGTGKNRRDWIHVEDCCEGIRSLIEADIRTVKGKDLFIASGRTENVLTVADLILTCLKKDRSLIRHIQDRPAHVETFSLSTKPMARLTGFTASIPLEEGLLQTVQWYSENTRWWRRIRRSRAFTRFYQDWYRGMDSGFARLHGTKG